MNQQFINRVKSLGWRAGMMGLAAIVAFILENINVLELTPVLTTMLGLVLGEVSKYLNTKKY